MSTQGVRPQHPAIRFRRLAISGGSRLTPEAARFWECLGRAFAREEGLLIVTGGLHSRNDAPGSIAADWAFVKGLKAESARDAGEALQGRVETLLPSHDRDESARLARFREGAVVELKNCNPQSRRFYMVNSADVIVSIAGDTGTRTVLDLALAIGKPVLPVPFAQGVSETVWRENLDDIRKWFEISNDDAAQIDRICLTEMTDAQMRDLAQRVKAHIGKGFMRKCLIIMPFSNDKAPLFDGVIRPALESLRIIPVRIDRLGLTGNAMDVFRQALSSCHGVIADISDNNPNVMYELGMAHAENKPTIIMCDGNLGGIPFDLRNHYILDCSTGRNSLIASLIESLRQIFT